MGKKTKVAIETLFQLGDRVRIKALPWLVGRISELRGPLGPGGALVYGVKIHEKPRGSYIELTGEQIEYLPFVGVEGTDTATGATKVNKGG